MIARVVISAPKGMSDKTIVTLAILRDLRKRGYNVAHSKWGMIT
ncbi:hypothetical protein [Pyrobaculum arsenaticum]|nr:hypothetical protein [Pyrobaculum arsenaticum]